MVSVINKGRAAAALAAAVACAPALAEERTDPQGWNASAMGVYVIEDSDRFDVDYGAGIRNVAHTFFSHSIQSVH